MVEVRGPVESKDRGEFFMRKRLRFTSAGYFGKKDLGVGRDLDTREFSDSDRGLAHNGRVDCSFMKQRGAQTIELDGSKDVSSVAEKAFTQVRIDGVYGNDGLI